MPGHNYLLFAICIAAISSTIAFAESPTSSANKTTAAVAKNAAGQQARLSKLYSQEMQKASKAGVTVFYPSVVPARFSLHSFKLNESEGNKNIDYTLEFRDKKRT